MERRGDHFMPIDSSTETIIEFDVARTAFPGDKRLSLATLHRWRLKGIRGVRLETILVGGRRCTSREAIGRFIAEQNAGDTPTPAFSPSQRKRMAEAAQLALSRAGV